MLVDFHLSRYLLVFFRGIRRILPWDLAGSRGCKMEHHEILSRYPTAFRGTFHGELRGRISGGVPFGGITRVPAGPHGVPWVPS